MLKIISLVIEIVWFFVKGVAKQNEEAAKKRAELQEEFTTSVKDGSRRVRDRFLGKLRK